MPEPWPLLLPREGKGGCVAFELAHARTTSAAMLCLTNHATPAEVHRASCSVLLNPSSFSVGGGYFPQHGLGAKLVRLRLGSNLGSGAAHPLKEQPLGPPSEVRTPMPARPGGFTPLAGTPARYPDFPIQLYSDQRPNFSRSSVDYATCISPACGWTEFNPTLRPEANDQYKKTDETSPLPPSILD